MSGPSAPLGVHMRDGFLLAVKELGGKLGGQPTDVIVVDDELKPDVAVSKVKGLLDRDKVDVVAGVVFSNVMMAVSKPVFENETFLISGNAGPRRWPARGALPISSPRPIRTTRTTKSWASMPRIRATSAWY